MNRQEMLQRALSRTEPWDIVIIGGGATGVGAAVDAASRGYQVLLLEQSDFGKGTSSRSTKLVHGGVRYLEQGNISLVMEALRERGILRQNAPHLVSDLAFVVPRYDWWEAPFYGLGLKLYDLLAGEYGFGASQLLSREETLARLPTQAGDWWASTLYSIIPNWQLFWLADAIETGKNTFQWAYVGKAFGYAVCYAGAALAVGTALFEERELS